MLHLDPVSPDDLRRLDAERAEPCVSLYLPTQPPTLPALRQDTVAFREMRRDLRARAEAAGFGTAVIAAIDDQLEAINEDPEFWRYMAHGLAVFVTPERIRTIRLPMPVERRIDISDRFHIKPLVPLIARAHDAFVLEIAQKRVRLLSVTEGDVVEVDAPGLPKGLDDYLENNRTPENTHTAEMQQSAEKKMRQRQFAHGLERALRPVLRGRKEPLVLAGVETILTYFKEVDTYPHTAQETISGNQEHTPDIQIAERARAIAEQDYRRKVDASLERVNALRNDNRGSTDLSEIARAAEEGRVETLVVTLDESIYGRLEDGIGSFVPGAEASPTTYDVLDEIVGRTIRTGGAVLAAHADALPEGLKAAAVFRYAA